jgi:hypothetical protein
VSDDRPVVPDTPDRSPRLAGPPPAAKLGWRIEPDGAHWAATLWGTESGDLLTIQGLRTMGESLHLVAVWHVLLTCSRKDEATQLLQEFTGRGRPS